MHSETKMKTKTALFMAIHSILSAPNFGVLVEQIKRGELLMGHPSNSAPFYFLFFLCRLRFEVCLNDLYISVQPSRRESHTTMLFFHNLDNKKDVRELDSLELERNGRREEKNYVKQRLME